MPVSGIGAPSSSYASALLTGLIARGLRHIVLSPGSRSQALALAAAHLERAGLVRLHVRIDERVAGFLALGIGVESGMPAAVITTSGTATAELHAPVLEAHHSGVPLIVLTADRPEELRGVRANQTTVQAGLYGSSVRLEMDVAAPSGAAGETDAAARLAADAIAAARGIHSLDPGPVHLNLAFREPLSGAGPDARALAARIAQLREQVEAEESGSEGGQADREAAPGGESLAPDPAGSASVAVSADAPAPRERTPAVLSRGPRTVVVAGHGAGPDAEELAHAGGWPLLAEVTSASRYGRELIVGYRELLAEADLGGRIERAVVFGHPTLSREIPALLSRDDVEVVVVAPHGADVVNPGKRAIRVASRVRLDDSAAPEDARSWLGAWVVAGRALSAAGEGDPTEVAPDVDAARSLVPRERIAFARTEYAAAKAPVTRRMLVQTVWRFSWPHDRLVLGASRLIREADRSVPGKKIRVHANRGLAGIDGTVSTAIGVALAAADAQTRPGRGGVTRVLLGDLAMLHDAGALLFGAGEDRPAIQVVVGNDGGGTMFDLLEVAGTTDADAFERVMRTPQHADFAALASAYGWEHTLATTHGALEQALSTPGATPQLIEVPLAGE